MNVTPKIVSGRVVNTRIFSSLTPGTSSLNATSTPSERPIQFRCIVVICSGQSILEKSSNSSAYAVVLRNHCSISRDSTRVSSWRQQ